MEDLLGDQKSDDDPRTQNPKEEFKNLGEDPFCWYPMNGRDLRNPLGRGAPNFANAAEANAFYAQQANRRYRWQSCENQKKRNILQLYIYVST